MSEPSLRPPTLGDVDALFAVYGDPGTWRHLPEGRFTDRAQMETLVRVWIDEWAEVGMSTRVVEVDGQVVGNCGTMPRGDWWNLGFRLATSTWGHGVASAVAGLTVREAQHHRPNWPVVARSLVTNPASGRVSEKAGLRRLWSGHSVDGPDRVIHADRDLEPELFEAIKALG